MKNIWQEIPSPITCLAPMEAVTDTVFRRVVALCGRPSVFFTEFTNVEGLFSGTKKRQSREDCQRRKPLQILKKFYKVYCQNFEGAGELRFELMESQTREEIEIKLQRFLEMNQIEADFKQALETLGKRMNFLENDSRASDTKLDSWLGNQEVVHEMGFELGPGFDRVAERMWFTRVEKPLIWQIWGKDPENFVKAGRLAVAMGFDGVDLNMGCPDKNVVKAGLGSALVLDKGRATEIIAATKEGLNGRLPLSVKIRIGYKEIDTENWSNILLEQGIEALTVHGRTTKQMSKVPANWDEIAKVLAIRNSIGCETKIIGNGDVTSLSDVENKIKLYGVDGIMIGRGIFSDPWLFEHQHPRSSRLQKDVVGRLALLWWHTQLFESVWAPAAEK